MAVATTMSCLKKKKILIKRKKSETEALTMEIV